jgi:phosphinothricin acetyltransferase
LITISEAEGYWTLQGQVMAQNKASHALLSGAGFREVGRRERYGHIDGDWRDVILMERRSAIAGGAGLPTKSCG